MLKETLWLSLFPWCAVWSYPTHPFPHKPYCYIAIWDTHRHVNASPIPWEVDLKINKNNNNNLIFCHKKQLASLAHYVQKPKHSPEASSKVVRQYAHFCPGRSWNNFLISWYHSQSPVGSVARTASSQTPECLLHDKKCCNSVRAILPTLGSKNAKQESPL